MMFLSFEYFHGNTSKLNAGVATLLIREMFWYQTGNGPLPESTMMMDGIIWIYKNMLRRHLGLQFLTAMMFSGMHK